MSPSHYQLLSHCTDEQLQKICERRKLPVPKGWQEVTEGRTRLLKTMVFHLEDNKQLTNTLLDLDSRELMALKLLTEKGQAPEESLQGKMIDLGLLFRTDEGWALASRVADALADFDDSAFCFQAGAEVVAAGFVIDLPELGGADKLRALKLKK